MIGIASTCVPLLLAVLPQEPASPAPVAATPAIGEARYATIVDVPVPDDVVLEVGGIAERERELFVSTRRGEVWRIEEPYAQKPKFSLWAEGLQEPLGLLDHDGWLYCAQRGELSRMRDADGDGRMDDLETVSSGWTLSGNYHEYCFGPALAKDGSMWLTLNKPFGDEPFGRAPFRGFAVAVQKGGSWVAECAGLRSPAGVAAAPWGEVFYTDNQGEWCATSKFAPLQRGDFHGHPWGIASCADPRSKATHPGEVKSGMRMEEAARTIPNFRLPAVWIPYDECGRSPAGFVWDDQGRFGPYRGQVFCGDQYSSEVFRMSLEQVQGRWQGACYPFRRGFACGIVRVAWAKDGSLWCGLTNRGWGSLGQSQHGLQRLVWNGETPFDLIEVTATREGFDLRFSMPVDAASLAADAIRVKSWTYDHHESYGCPPRDVKPHDATFAVANGDGTVVHLTVKDPAICRVYAIDASLVRASKVGGAEPVPMLHGRAWYTRNAAP